MMLDDDTAARKNLKLAAKELVGITRPHQGGANKGSKSHVTK